MDKNQYIEEEIKKQEELDKVKKFRRGGHGVAKKIAAIALGIAMTFGAGVALSACGPEKDPGNDPGIIVPDPDDPGKEPEDPDKPVDPDAPGKDPTDPENPDKPEDPDKPTDPDEPEKPIEDLIYLDNAYKFNEIHQSIVSHIDGYKSGEELFSYIDGDKYLNIATVVDSNVEGNDKSFVINKVNVELNQDYTFDELEEAVESASSLVTTSKMFDFRNMNQGAYYESNKDFVDSLQAIAVGDCEYVFKTFNTNEANGEIGVYVYGVNINENGEIVFNEGKVVGSKEDIVNDPTSVKLVEAKSQKDDLIGEVKANEEFNVKFAEDEYVIPDEGLTEEEIAAEADKIYGKILNADGTDWEKDEAGNYIEKLKLEEIKNKVVASIEGMNPKVPYKEEMFSIYDEENDILKIVSYFKDFDNNSGIYITDVDLDLDSFNNSFAKMDEYLADIRPRNWENYGYVNGYSTLDDEYNLNAENKDMTDTLLLANKLTKDDYLIAFTGPLTEYAADDNIGNSIGFTMSTLTLDEAGNLNWNEYLVKSSTVLGTDWRTNLKDFIDPNYDGPTRVVVKNFKTTYITNINVENIIFNKDFGQKEEAVASKNNVIAYSKKRETEDLIK